MSLVKKIGSLLIIYLSTTAFAKNIKVSATVDRNQVSVSDSLVYTVTVTSEGSVQAQEPRLPTLAHFNLVNQWTGTQIQSTYTGGSFKTIRSQAYNYRLIPQKVGKLRIPSSEVVVDGKSYNTKPIVVNVVKASQKRNQRAQRPQQRPFGLFNSLQDEMDEVFNNLMQRDPLLDKQGTQTLPTNPNDSFFIQVQVDKTEVYVGEQVTASWYLYTRGSLRDIDTLKFPSLKGFWKEDIEIPTRFTFEREIINGIVYNKALLSSAALFPIKEGKSTVDAYTARCTVVMGFGFGGRKRFQATKSSKEIDITVLPIPLANQPEDFSGAVGEFSVTAQLDGKEFKENQPLPYKIKFQGRGNAKLIEMPKVPFPESLELYDIKKSSKFFKTGESFKEFELLIIPRGSGEMEIPGFSVSVFNPKTKTYLSQSIDPVKIFVEADPNAPKIESKPLAEEKTQKTSPGEQDVAPPLITFERPLEIPTQVGMYAVAGVNAFSLLFLLFFGWRTFGGVSRKRDLEQLTQIRLQSVRSHLSKGDWRSVGIEGTNALYFVMGHITEQGGATKELAKLLLHAAPSVRRELGEKFEKTLRQLELLGFAPEDAVGSLKDKKEMQKLISEVEKLLMKAIRLQTKDEE